MPDQAKADFQTTGLTHLLAVSGSNLTLVLGFVLSTARWLRVRGYGLAVVGLFAVVFFVLLARPQPSVLRAAAMGVVALAGLSGGSRNRGVRVLCVAVLALVVVDPWLARSVGFILSALASAGILLLAPRWRDLLARWLPRPLAEAIAVPLAAQIVCTPVIAAISGQVSVVAVFANIAVAPAVGPATIASLLAGLTAIASPTGGHLAGRLAGIPLWWIVWVAHRGAAIAGASVAWGADARSLVILGVICVVVIAMLPKILPHKGSCLSATGLLIVVLLHPPGVPGWPPPGWVMVMCDVGQGDGLVLNAGGGSVVVVDTGPDPQLMGQCLEQLHVSQIPLVVLTHFHADHVDGLPAVLAAAPVGEIETSPYDEPTDRYRDVISEASKAKVPVTTAVPGERRRIGQLSWRVLGPPAATADGSGEDDGSGPNNASVIMLVRVAGFRILLAGDAETEEDDALLAEGTHLRVDVLKEPHHGSSTLDPRFLAATHAAVSLISVGAGNPYGHPAQRTLTWLRRLHMAVYRTDQSGSIAVAIQGGRLVIVTSRRA
jgi:competence protein ComEC